MNDSHQNLVPVAETSQTIVEYLNECYNKHYLQ